MTQPTQWSRPRHAQPDTVFEQIYYRRCTQRTRVALASTTLLFLLLIIISCTLANH